MFGEKAGDYHSDSVMDPPGLIQLPHSRIYNWITCFAFAPFFKFRFVVAPLDIFIFFLETMLHHFRKMKKDLHKEFSPDQFIQPGFVMAQSKLNTLPNRNCSKSQSDSQMCCGVKSWKISVFIIYINDFGFQFWLFKFQSVFSNPISFKVKIFFFGSF